MPLVVIDCSMQNVSLKNAPVDVKVELNEKDIFPRNSQSIVSYCTILLSSTIRFLVMSELQFKSVSHVSLFGWFRGLLVARQPAAAQRVIHSSNR